MFLTWRRFPRRDRGAQQRLSCTPSALLPSQLCEHKQRHTRSRLLAVSLEDCERPLAHFASLPEPSSAEIYFGKSIPNVGSFRSRLGGESHARLLRLAIETFGIRIPPFCEP